MHLSFSHRPTLVGRDIDGRFNVHPATFLVEVDVSFDEGEDGVVAAHADIPPGMPLGSLLADNNVAGNDEFAAELLDTQSLGDRVTTVAAGTLTLLMSHRQYPF